MSFEYMSQEGYDKLVAELHQLESVELPQVREAIAEARVSNRVCWVEYVSSRRYWPMQGWWICRAWLVTVSNCSVKWK